MNFASWPKALSIAGVVLAATAALATPIKTPKRVIGQQTVDLTPLFQWWTNRTGTRPFPGWVHVTGNIVGTNSYGWVVDAHIDPSGQPGSEAGTNSAKAGINRRILLQHPPLRDRAAFEQLAAQLQTLNEQRAQAADAELQAHRYLHPGSNGVRRLESKAQAWKHQEMAATEQNAAASKKQLDEQIQGLKAKLAAWPNPNHYEVDCFALTTGAQVNRLPLYEHGLNWQ